MLLHKQTVRKYILFFSKIMNKMINYISFRKLQSYIFDDLKNQKGLFTLTSKLFTPWWGEKSLSDSLYKIVFSGHTFFLITTVKCGFFFARSSRFCLFKHLLDVIFAISDFLLLYLYQISIFAGGELRDWQNNVKITNINSLRKKQCLQYCKSDVLNYS